MGSFSTIGEGVRKLSELEIDTDLAMDGYNITLADGKTVDGVDISQSEENLRQLIKQVHPTLQVLEAIDEGNTSLGKVDSVYRMDCVDEHNDNSVNSAIWEFIEEGTYGSASIEELDNAYMRVKATSDYDQPAKDSIAEIKFKVAKLEAKIRSRKFNTESWNRLEVIGASTHYYNIPTDDTYRVYKVFKDGGDVVITEDDTEKVREADSAETFTIRYKAHAYNANYSSQTDVRAEIDVDYTKWEGALSGLALSKEISTDADVLSFFKHLRFKVSNGGSTHATPVQAEIYGNADSYASPLHSTKFTIDPNNPVIELFREDISEPAKSDAQTTWVMDDNTTDGALPAKAGDKHATILAEEIGVASIIAVEKSVIGDFTDTVVLAEGDDYVVDYSNRKATKIILSTGAASDIVAGQSRLRITWIADIMNIDAATNNTVLKVKIYLNRLSPAEASPEIQPLEIGISKYVELQYMTG